MKKIKIGLFILSNSWGGAEEGVYNIASNLNKSEFEIHLFINDFIYNNYSEIRDVKIHNLGQLESNKKLKKILSAIKIRSQLLKVVKESQVQLIHAQLENTLLVIGMSFRKINIPLIFTLRGDETKIYHSPKTLEQKIIQIIIMYMFRRKNTTITSISKWLKKDFKDKSKSQIVITPNGVNCKIFKPIKTKKIKNTVLFVGRLVKGKGITDLLNVASELKDYEYIFAGRGPMGKLIIYANTKYLGFKNREQLVKLFNEATICAFPSHREAFGRVGLEAMACGKAIVASDLGFSDYIENGKDGILIEPGSRLQLKEAIVSIMENSTLRARLEVNARRKALKYDITHTVSRYEDLYKKMIIK